MRSTTLFVPALVLAALAAPARADQFQYAGMHPLAGRPDDGFCYIEVPHVHVQAPPRRARVLYRVHDERYYFIADPVPFGYDGPRFPYHGPHPVTFAELDEPEYCYLDGPHYHEVAPADAAFTLEADVYWYVGKLPPAFVTERPRYVRVNAYYQPVEYERPVVVASAAPVGYVGPSVQVIAPVVEIEALAELHVPPPPRIHAGVSIEAVLPGVVVVGGDQHHERVYVGKQKHYKHKHYKHKRYKHRGHIRRR